MAAPNRTLKLTDAEIGIIQNALGLASRKNYDLYEELCKMANVPNNERSRAKQIENAKFYFEQYNDFSELSSAIANSEKDV